MPTIGADGSLGSGPGRDYQSQAAEIRSALFFYHEALKQMPHARIRAAMADVYRKTGRPDWAAEQDRKEASQSIRDSAVDRVLKVQPA